MCCGGRADAGNAGAGDRFGERAGLHQLQHDQQASDASITVVERMQGFELVVRHASGDDRVDALPVVAGHPVDQVSHLVLEVQSRRTRHEASVLNAGAGVRTDQHLDVSQPA